MAEDVTATNEAFDLNELRELIAMMELHGVTEIDLKRGDRRWRIRRGPAEVVQMVSAPAYGGVPAMAPAPAPAAAPAAPAAAATAAPEAKAPADDSVPIKSPTVGTFYSAAAPGDEPFVSVGSKVNSESVVCIIEAMKVFNQIPSEVNGTITQVLCKNGDPIEFGQPLFMIRLG